MEEIYFEWNSNKAIANLKKHGVSFEEAKTVFSDEHARLIPDPDNSQGEERFLLLGKSAVFNLLIVCHCYRTHGENDANTQLSETPANIRIISARTANKHERKAYRYWK